MKKLYLLSLLLVGYLGLLQAQPTIEIDDATGDPGNVVSINFKVSDFSELIGMQFSVNWDPNVLAFKSVSNITDAIRYFDAGAFNTDANFTDDGNMVVQWFDLDAEGVTVPDGTIMFTIDFDVVGGGGSSTTIGITGDPRDIEIIDVDENILTPTIDAGSFTATGMGGGTSLRFIGSDETGTTGSNVCVEVTVQGFDNIAGMQLSINWDPSFLTYTGVGDFNLSGFNEGTFNLDDVANGKAGLQWSDPAANGITLANGTKIFEICFDIIGSNGNRAVQFTNDPVAIEIVDGDDNRVNFTKKDGSVTVGGGGGGSDCNVEGFALVASNETPSGNTVCVDIDVKDFNLATSLAATIEWDPAIIANPQIQNIDLNGLSENLFNLDEGANGRLGFIWSDPSTDGVTLADGTTIFQVCFDVIGSTGNSAISFTDNLVDREYSEDGAAVAFGQCNGSVDLGGSGQALSFTTNAPSCPGETNGSISVNTNFGTSPYTYEWTSGGQTVGTAEDLNNIGAGTYVLEATDAGGQTESIEVIVNDPEGVEIISSNITDASEGMSDGAIALTITGGATPLRFNWSNGGTTRDIAGLSSGAYTVTITDANGCVLEQSFSVGGGDLSISLDISDYNGSGISCNGEDDGEITALASGGATPYTYNWSVSGDGATITDLGPGDYSVTVTDATGASVTASGTITEPDQLQVGVTTSPSPTGVEGTALAEVNGGTEPYNYSWNDQTPPSRTRLINMLPVGSYTVIVTDVNGCQAQGTGVVTETPVECYTGRLVMTPNDDGRNDALDISCVSSMENELEVYNRHGELVYQENNYVNTWLGVDRSGEPLPDGAYFWVIRVRTGNGMEQYKGHVTLLRTLN